MVELRAISFENVHKVLQLKPAEYQKDFVEDISVTIALAYTGIIEKYPGELSVIYYDNEPVGVILIGKSPITLQEPKVLKKYKSAYRFMGFFISGDYQRKGIGRIAFKMALEKVESYPDGRSLPITLEVKIHNETAINLYKSFGFIDSGVRYGDDCAFIRLPQ
jgi:diamine N-acetyltransferase